MKIDYLKYGMDTLVFGVTLGMLSLVCVTDSALLPGEAVGRWVWFDKAALAAVVCISASLLLPTRGKLLSFSSAVSFSLMILGGVEAILGIRQLYGFAASNHSLFALTGSFFNPGPYSGYLAMALPVCLHRWMLTDGKRWERMFSGGVMVLILCVLPAGMSRSAWLAAGASCLWVYACHAGWWKHLQRMWRLSRKRLVVVAVVAMGIMVLAGVLLFTLKPDSARGRLFMWKMSCRAVAERPVAGHGVGSFATAYGNAQEAYFAAGDYEAWEEHVAGSPEYAFNEYLQMAVEIGIPLSICVLAGIGICLYIGMLKKRFGICGAIFSLMIFSFFSYPLQLPAFVVMLGALLPACVLGNSRLEWICLAVLTGAAGGFRLDRDLKTEHACKEWMNARVLYNAGAYEAAERSYKGLYPLLKDRAAFLFEYGHGLHKLRKFEASNRILKEAMRWSCDPMILNVIGKNCQLAGEYSLAEDWFIRSTHRLPGRIYPYYLLAKLYAEPDFRQPEKLEAMKRIVLTKRPKVDSSAIRQMREEVKRIEIFTNF
ncbi:O-antigen ligase family protein [Bacteroides helcogenes]|uniref:O-antigen polymerase n=1 Tax=Bacteroides helcogenes (strain ATCC 35417 / DSM 20613 / JCM 6297 / CCUG 15421 / P 36-108) TaxID=693979 RepID=E6SUJ4_BACT6|nr:O-antigen ligase family protein [Bacteroides helcogenes]ADV43358.1 O-antigen polymerase [Bacteroides helcogenes P 36-108]MDY5238126.1 O-antigen ligase family protein [Bacteroides helcogenes]